MNNHWWSKTALIAMAAVLSFGLARPASAFYLEMPEALKDLFALMKVNSTRAEDGGTFQPMSPQPLMTDSQPLNPPSTDQPVLTSPSTGDAYANNQYRSPEPSPAPSMPSQPMGDNFGRQYQGDKMMPSVQPYQNTNQPDQWRDAANNGEGNNQKQPPSGQYNQGQTCNIDGKEVPGPCPRNDYQNGDNSNNQSGQKNEGMNDNRQGREGGGEMDLANMKRGIKQMDNNLKRFDKMVTDLGKKGGQVPQEVKDKLAKAKSLSEGLKAATTAEEMQTVGMDEYQEILQDLEESRQEIFEKAQRLQDVKRNIKGMEQGLKMFESQTARLKKQKITLPTDLSEKVAKARTTLNAIKSAKTWDEVESAGMEDLQDTFMSLDESREQLEMISRWPKTLKQVNTQLAGMDRELKRDKAIVDKLLKKGIDLNSNYSLFAEAIAKLKATRDDAVAKMAAGQSQEAFDALENDFFGQMDDAWENGRVIQMMNNLGRFNQDFKRGVASMNTTINKLKKKKVDVSGLTEILAQIKEKGASVTALLKEKPVDQEAISVELQDMEGLRLDFENQVDESVGDGEDMPWEKGPQQFKSMQMSSSLNQYIDKKPQPMEDKNNFGSGPMPTPPSTSLAPLPSP
ncbi:MAG: hypothetical protein AAB390_01520 [Patescibacteria group bacterium]